MDDSAHGDRQPGERSDGGDAGWRASLRLEFEQLPGQNRTSLVSRRHVGPLRVLKALDSDDGQRLEAVIVHPPGGLVAGDRLELSVRAGPGSSVLLTTPGAQKWYRSRAGCQAFMHTQLQAAAAARLDWLPQPSILFDGARAVQSLEITMAADASVLGWEMLVRGRAAMGEHWREGTLEQSLAIDVEGEPWWRQRLCAAADDRLFSSPLGWQDRRLAASVWSCEPRRSRIDSEALRDHWRDRLDAAAAPALLGGATVVNEGLVLAQILGDDIETVQDVAVALWQSARQGPSLPRIWRT